MAGFLDEIAARLVSVLGVVIDASLFLSSAADAPEGPGPYGGKDYFLTIRDTGGSAGQPARAAAGIEIASAQIVSVGPTYQKAAAGARAAHAALGGQNGLHNATLSGVTYVRLRPRGNPGDLGLDEAERPMVAFNIEADKQPS